MNSTTNLLLILSLLVFGSLLAKSQETQDKKAHEIYLYGNLKELIINGVAFKSEIKPNQIGRAHV